MLVWSGFFTGTKQSYPSITMLRRKCNIVVVSPRKPLVLKLLLIQRSYRWKINIGVYFMQKAIWSYSRTCFEIAKHQSKPFRIFPFRLLRARIVLGLAMGVLTIFSGRCRLQQNLNSQLLWPTSWCICYLKRKLERFHDYIGSSCWHHDVIYDLVSSLTNKAFSN